MPKCMQDAIVSHMREEMFLLFLFRTGAFSRANHSQPYEPRLPAKKLASCYGSYSLCTFHCTTFVQLLLISHSAAAGTPRLLISSFDSDTKKPLPVY